MRFTEKHIKAIKATKVDSIKCYDEYVSIAEGVMTVTNGNILLQIPMDDYTPEDSDCIIQKEAILLAYTASGKGKTVEIARIGNAILLYALDVYGNKVTSFVSKPNQYRYPDVKAVVDYDKQKKPVITIGVSVAMLQQLVNSLDKKTKLTLSFTHHLSGIRVETFDGDDTITGLIMPLRTDKGFTINTQTGGGLR